MQPWGLQALTGNILSGFSDSPFDIPPYLTAWLHTGTRSDISNQPPAYGRSEPRKAGADAQVLDTHKPTWAFAPASTSG